jgi:hypothetical protein
MNWNIADRPRLDGGRTASTAVKLSVKVTGTIQVRSHLVSPLQGPSASCFIERMEFAFRETLPSDVEGLFSVRARTRENPISKEELASLGITSEGIASSVASGRIKGWFSCWQCFRNMSARVSAQDSLHASQAGSRPPASPLYGSQRRQTRVRGLTVFIAPTDGTRVVKSMRTMTKFSCTSRTNYLHLARLDRLSPP